MVHDPYFQFCELMPSISNINAADDQKRKEVPWCDNIMERSKIYIYISIVFYYLSWINIRLIFFFRRVVKYITYRKIRN